jgi:hypothetical protein
MVGMVGEEGGRESGRLGFFAASLPDDVDPTPKTNQLVTEKGSCATRCPRVDGPTEPWWWDGQAVSWCRMGRAGAAFAQLGAAPPLRAWLPGR